MYGKSSNKFNSLRDRLIKVLSNIEAKIDFAEDDLPEKVLKEVHNSIKEIHKDIHKIIEDNKIGEKIRDGFKVSITGEVNAGKSSLLNLIAKRDVAIVSDEAGTTRDVIETYLNIDGYPVILADTAGIRDAKNEIEKKGISLALGKSKEADLNIVVIDNSSKNINDEIKKMINKDTIVLLNKSDILLLPSSAKNIKSRNKYWNKYFKIQKSRLAPGLYVGDAGSLRQRSETVNLSVRAFLGPCTTDHRFWSGAPSLSADRRA